MKRNQKFHIKRERKKKLKRQKQQNLIDEKRLQNRMHNPEIFKPMN